MMPNTSGTTPEQSYTPEERTAIKYRFLRDKILLHFQKGKRILLIAKIVATVLFLVFTAIAVAGARRTGNAGGWLQAWILMIFLNITVFIIADYSRYLVESRVIPYLENDEQVEFGEYDIFLEDIDGENEDEEADENEEAENGGASDPGTPAKTGESVNGEVSE